MKLVGKFASFLGIFCLLVVINHFIFIVTRLIGEPTLIAGMGWSVNTTAPFASLILWVVVGLFAGGASYMLDPANPLALQHREEGHEQEIEAVLDATLLSDTAHEVGGDAAIASTPKPQSRPKRVGMLGDGGRRQSVGGGFGRRSRAHG